MFWLIANIIWNICLRLSYTSLLIIVDSLLIWMIHVKTDYISLYFCLCPLLYFIGAHYWLSQEGDLVFAGLLFRSYVTLIVLGFSSIKKWFGWDSIRACFFFLALGQGLIFINAVLSRWDSWFLRECVKAKLSACGWHAFCMHGKIILNMTLKKENVSLFMYELNYLWERRKIVQWKIAQNLVGTTMFDLSYRVEN